MLFRLPFRRQVEAVGRLHDRYGFRWFTVAEAAHALDEDGVVRVCRDAVRYRNNVRRRLQRLVGQGVLYSMRHPAPHTRHPVLQFRVSLEGKKLIDLYQRQGEAQRDMDDVLELL